MIDDKLQTYIIMLALGALTYALFRFNPIGDTIVTILFIFSSYRLIFTQKEKYYSEEEVYEIPENYVAQNVSLNLYSFRIVFTIIGFSIVYYVGVFLFGVKAGVVLLPSWLVIACVYYLVRTQGSKRLELKLLINYVVKRIEDETQNTELIREIVRLIYKSRELEAEELNKLLKNKFPSVPDSIISSILTYTFEFEKAFNSEYERISTTDTR